jgi:Fe-S cluster assembly protein SufD
MGHRRAQRGAGAGAGRMGLPTRRDEYWKYTDPDSLTQADQAPAAASSTNRTRHRCSTASTG